MRSARGSVNAGRWNGWVYYTTPVKQEYERVDGFGPVPRLNSRRKASEVGIWEDRMWPTLDGTNTARLHLPAR